MFRSLWVLVTTCLLLVSCAMALMPTGATVGMIYYVNPNTGNDGNNCQAAANTSGTTPKRSLLGTGTDAGQFNDPPDGALRCLTAGAGDTLILQDGIYPDGVYNCGSGYPCIPSGQDIDHPTVVKAEHKGLAVLKPTMIRTDGRSGRIINLVNAEYITIDGLTLDMGNLGCGNGVGVALGDDTGYLTQVVVQNMDIGNQCLPSGDPNGEGIGSGGHIRPGVGAQFSVKFLNNVIHDMAYGYRGGFEAVTMGFYIVGEYTIVEGNIFHHIAGWCGESWSSGSSNEDDIHGPKRPNNNIYRNNICHHVGSSGMWFSAGDNMQIYNNIIYNTGENPNAGNEGIIANGSAGQPSNNMQIYNNTIFGNSVSATTPCVAVASHNTNTVIRNNICWGNTNDTILNGSGSTIIDHNLCTGTGCSVHQDPKFASTNPSDPTFLHLSSNSPSPPIDAGVDMTAAPINYSFDADLKPRKCCGPGAVVDYGAYEFGSGGVPPPTLGPIAWWKYENDGTDAVSGNLNPQTITTGLTFGQPKVDTKSLVCDGAHASATTTGPLPPSGNYTWRMWYLAPAAPTTTRNEIVIQNGDMSDTYGFKWSATDWKQSAYHNQSGNSYVSAPVTATLQANTWYYLAATYDGQNLTMYLGPQPQSTVQAMSMIASSGNFHACGAPLVGNFAQANSRIDDLRLWNFALSQQQIQADYAATVGAPRHRAPLR